MQRGLNIIFREIRTQISYCSAGMKGSNICANSNDRLACTLRIESPVENRLEYALALSGHP